MIRKLKVLGIALGAVFAFSAMTASAASAVDTFTSSVSPAVVTGTGTDHVFTITAGEATPGKTSKHNVFECKTAKFSATLSNGASKVTAYATYTGNKAAGQEDAKECDASVGKVTVDMNGCTYDLTGETTQEHPKGSAKFDAKIWVSCPLGKKIEITGALGCTVSVPSQTPAEGGVTYTNGTNAKTGKKDVLITATVTGITYEATGACSLVGIPSHGTNADYTGTVTIDGFKDECKVTCPENGDEFKHPATADVDIESSKS